MIHFLFKSIKRSFAPILILLIGTYLCFLPEYAPILTFDDWYNFGQLYVFGGLRFVDLANRRPFLYTVPKFLFSLFGFNLKAIYLEQMFVLFLCGAVFFFLARRLFSRHPYLALPAALLFIVFPADLTRMWLSLNFLWANYLVTLLAFYLMLDYAEHGQLWKLALSLPLIVLPLGAHESQLGLVVAWSVLLAVFTPKIQRQRRLLLLYPIGIAALFLFWRFFFQPAVLNIHDQYIADANSNLKTSIINGLKAIFPVLINSWIQPFASLLGISAQRMLLIVIGTIICAGLLAFWASKEDACTGKEKALADSVDPANRIHADSPATNQLTLKEKKQESLQLLTTFGMGLGMLLAGYFPYLLIVTPSLDWIGSRANIFANFGGSLVITAGIALAGLWAARQRSQLRLIVIVAMIPLLLMGFTEQMWNQKEANQAWVEQKHFWRALFTAVPNLKDGTTVVVAMPYDTTDQPYRRLPFRASWELSGGLKVLYNNPTLVACPYTPNHAEGSGYCTFTQEGIENVNTGLVPYDKMVIVYYELGSYEVKIVHPENAQFTLKFAMPGYAPEKYILPDPPQSTPYRGLVIK